TNQMSYENSVPPEIWLEVFKHAPNKALLSLSLTSQSFRHLSRPLLFSHFHFHPYAIGPGDGILLPSSLKVENAKERLDFWCSEQIAPLVRSCNISPWTRSLHSKQTFSGTETPHILLARFFDHLQCFTGLQQLSAYQIHFTGSAIAKLSTMARDSLRHLRVQLCEVDDGEGLQSATSASALSVFTFYDKVRRADRDELKAWIHLLHPSHLRELHLTCNLRFLAFNPPFIPTFPCVTKLSIEFDFSIMDSNIAFLSRFPNVEHLAVTGWGEPINTSGSHPPCLAALRELSSLSCPPILLPVVPGSPLTSLTVSNCNAAAFTEQLRRMQVPRTITYLAVDFDSLEAVALGMILLFFPQLADLTISIGLVVKDDIYAEDGFNPIATKFFTALPGLAALPSGLRSISVSWLFEYGENDDPGHDKNFEFGAVRDALLQRCPALTSLWLDGDTLLLWWRRSAPDGAAEEHTAYDPTGAYHIRCFLEMEYWPLEIADPPVWSEI
ncbi:hypothetical protein GGX14DRAFT_466169, partial [Mycena pura]